MICQVTTVIYGHGCTSSYVDCKGRRANPHSNLQGRSHFFSVGIQTPIVLCLKPSIDIVSHSKYRLDLPVAFNLFYFQNGKT